jgi:effector-binding domain-containing protein
MVLPQPPSIVERADQPYIGIRRRITMEGFGELVDRIPELFAWLSTKNLAPAGPPFIRLNVIDMAAELECETGIPIGGAAANDGAVFAGILPGGRYVRYVHTGHPDDLIDVTAAVLSWADDAGLDWDMTETPAGQRWGCRLIVNITDPADEPDMSKCETELLFRLAD